MRLETARQAFVLHLTTIRRSPYTVSGRSTDLGLFIGHVIHQKGRDGVQHFTAEMVESWLGHMTMRGLKATTVRRCQTSLRAFAKWGLRKRYWASDPTVDLELVRIPDQLPRPLSAADRGAIMALRLPVEDRALRALLYYTGLRVGEISRIQLRHVTRPTVLPDGSPMLAKLHVLGKGGRERIVPLHPECWAAVEDQALNRTDNAELAFLFAHGLDERPWNRKVIWRRVGLWGKRAGVVACTPHRFRHAFATDLLERTKDLRAVQELLGHKSVATTQIYTRVVDARLMDAVMSLDPMPEAEAQDVSHGCGTPPPVAEDRRVTDGKERSAERGLTS